VATQRRDVIADPLGVRSLAIELVLERFDLFGCIGCRSVQVGERERSGFVRHMSDLLKTFIVVLQRKKAGQQPDLFVPNLRLR
jgi:hypothetical protein